MSPTNHGGKLRPPLSAPPIPSADLLAAETLPGTAIEESRTDAGRRVDPESWLPIEPSPADAEESDSSVLDPPTMLGLDPVSSIRTAYEGEGRPDSGGGRGDVSARRSSLDSTGLGSELGVSESGPRLLEVSTDSDLSSARSDLVGLFSTPPAPDPAESEAMGISPDASPGLRFDSGLVIAALESDAEEANGPVAESDEHTLLGRTRTLFRPKFEVLGVLGSGGMGTVFEAVHVELDRRVAIKVLNRAQSDPSIVQRMRREARVLAKIRHPGVVEIDDFDVTSDGRAFMVLEKLEGQDLESLLRDEGKLEPSSALLIGAQICEALAAAHAVGVVHRDLKPANIFVTERGARPRVKLLDFGAANLPDSARLTQIGMVVGTPSYMAPEQVFGETITTRTDLHAVGVLVYEMLTGSQPFAEGKLTEILTRVASVMPAELPEGLAGPETPAIWTTLERALAKKPEERWATADELHDALTAHALALDERREGWRLWPFSRRS
ncbi:MAG: serine/threonine protein kinase [Deltaproteobacteria bacterium]|nr:serine/threonine protein kinase [Deltaproteobacteria bacterium]